MKKSSINMAPKGRIPAIRILKEEKYKITEIHFKTVVSTFQDSH